jgi:hypothetical protein
MAIAFVANLGLADETRLIHCAAANGAIELPQIPIESQAA